MKHLFIILLSVYSFTIFAQTPRIALVKPNGNTTIHATLQDAYEAASNDNYIYLPGGTFQGINLAKKLHIIGAGANIDSSLTTGITKITGQFILQKEAVGGSIEGLNFLNGSALFFYNDTNTSVSGFTISRCDLSQSSNVNQGIWEGVIFQNNTLGSLGSFHNSLVRNNVIMGHCNVQFSQVKNNIFFHPVSGSFQLGNNNTFSNNIFQEGQYSSVPNSFFFNNVNLQAYHNTTESYNNINEPWLTIFENPGPCSGTPPSCGYDVHNDYHVKSTSACNNSGTDGTDRGIYGGSTPWVEGSVPSNPHIYFKQVSEETNASGQLQIHFKVRTGN